MTIETILLACILFVLICMVYVIRISIGAAIRKMEKNKREIMDKFEDLMDITEGFDPKEELDHLSKVRRHFEKVQSKEQQIRRSKK